MTEKKQEERIYKKGDEIVHAHYGVGKVVDIEKKELRGKTTQYYVVETKNSTFWLPVEEADNQRVRPIITPEKVEEIIKILSSEPEEMADHHKSRKSQIRKAKTDGEITTTAKLVRDLYYRQAVNRLNTTERKALENLRTRLVTEWSTSMDISPQNVNAKINKILQKHNKKQEEGE